MGLLGDDVCPPPIKIGQRPFLSNHFQTNVLTPITPLSESFCALLRAPFVFFVTFVPLRGDTYKAFLHFFVFLRVLRVSVVKFNVY